MAVRRASEKSKSGKVFGHRRKKPEMFRVGLYARVSTQDQQTIPLQMRGMREYAAARGWTIVLQVKEVGSGASARELRQKLMDAARRREIDIVLVWRLDRWGRSLPDLVTTLEELNHLGVGFISLTEALDLTTPTGRAMAGLLSVFAQFEHEILRERVRAGLAHARQNGKRLGRPATAAIKSAEIRKLLREGVSKAEIARRLNIGAAPRSAAFSLPGVQCNRAANSHGVPNQDHVAVHSAADLAADSGLGRHHACPAAHDPADRYGLGGLPSPPVFDWQTNLQRARS